MRTAVSKKKLSGCEVIYLHVGNSDARETGSTSESIVQNIKKVASLLLQMTIAKIYVSTPMRNIKNQIIDDKLANIENELYGIHTTNAAERVEIVNIYGLKILFIRKCIHTKPSTHKTRRKTSLPKNEG